MGVVSGFKEFFANFVAAYKDDKVKNKIQDKLFPRIRAFFSAISYACSLHKRMSEACNVNNGSFINKGSAAGFDSFNKHAVGRNNSGTGESADRMHNPASVSTLSLSGENATKAVKSADAGQSTGDIEKIIDINQMKDFLLSEGSQNSIKEFIDGEGFSNAKAAETFAKDLVNELFKSCKNKNTLDDAELSSYAKECVKNAFSSSDLKVAVEKAKTDYNPEGSDHNPFSQEESASLAGLEILSDAIRRAMKGKFPDKKARFI